MRKLQVAAAALGGLAAIAGVIAAHRYAGGERLEQLHFERAETELVIFNVSGTHLRLFRAGKSLQDPAEVPLPEDLRLWLPKDNYFLRADQREGPLFYPAPILAFRGGPERDGALDITVRPAPPHRPPRLLPHAPEFVYIPSGPFVLGDRLNPREPHYVWLTGYFISPCEVANAEFREFLSDSHEDLGRSQASARLAPGDRDYQRFGWPDQPVTSVSWLEANAFCRWLTARIGQDRWIYALPTDAEWEKAAKGPDSLDYGLSMTISDAESPLYNWKKNPEVPVTVVSCPGSGYLPNRYGLYHMSGNVAEWTRSVFRHYNREVPYVEDDRNHDSTEGRRSVRGGSWYSATSAPLYLPYRDSFQPEHTGNDVGFRVVARLRP